MAGSWCTFLLAAAADILRPARWMAVAAVTAVAVSASVAIEIVPATVTPFSRALPGARLPPGWRPTQLPKVPRETEYEIVEDEGTPVLRARADRSMSGLSHAVHVDLARSPVLRWRWKVSGVVAGGRIGTRTGDDYAARLYVFFDYDLGRLSFVARAKIKLARALYGEVVPAAGLCYVWDNEAPVGTMLPSAYSDRVRMIVAESGASRAGTWVALSRDVAEDFRSAFGEPAPPVTGVAIATDTDNTGDSLTAWYGDIGFGTTAGP